MIEWIIHERILIMDYMEKAHLAAKITVPDALKEVLRYVYAHNGKIFSTNGIVAFITTDEAVNNFTGIMHPLASKKKSDWEFEAISTPEQELALKQVEEMITQNLTTVLAYPDVEIMNIQDECEKKYSFDLDPKIVEAELEAKDAKKKKKKEPVSEEDELYPPEKKKRKIPTERAVKLNYSRFTLKNESDEFPLILCKDYMLDIINTYQGLPTLKAIRDWNQPACIKRNDKCQLKEDSYYLIMPYKTY